MAGRVIPFPIQPRGDPDPRRLALGVIKFRWDGEVWRRGRVMLRDEEIDMRDEPSWEQRLRRWTRQRPQRQR
jgi:hypothetical protein